MMKHMTRQSYPNLYNEKHDIRTYIYILNGISQVSSRFDAIPMTFVHTTLDEKNGWPETGVL